MPRKISEEEKRYVENFFEDLHANIIVVGGKIEMDYLRNRPLEIILHDLYPNGITLKIKNKRAADAEERLRQTKDGS